MSESRFRWGSTARRRARDIEEAALLLRASGFVRVAEYQRQEAEYQRQEAERERERLRERLRAAGIDPDA